MYIYIYIYIHTYIIDIILKAPAAVGDTAVGMC